MGLRERVERFYELLPAWVRHSLTTLLSLTTLVLVLFAIPLGLLTVQWSALWWLGPA